MDNLTKTIDSYELGAITLSIDEDDNGHLVCFEFQLPEEVGCQIRMPITDPDFDWKTAESILERITQAEAEAVVRPILSRLAPEFILKRRGTIH